MLAMRFRLFDCTMGENQVNAIEVAARLRVQFFFCFLNNVFTILLKTGILKRTVFKILSENGILVRTVFTTLFMHIKLQAAASYKLQAEGYKLQARGCKLQATGCKLQAAGHL